MNEKNNFATASMILGLCTIVGLCTVFLPLPLGALSILFAVLSKRKGQKLNSLALTGILTSIAGMVVSLVLSISIFTAAFNLLKPENRDLLNQQFEQLYGVDFEEYMEQIYGSDFDDYLDSFTQ